MSGFLSLRNRILIQSAKRLIMLESEMVQGKVYKLAKHVDGNRIGTEVIFNWFTKDGKCGIFSPVGEPDMQSMFSATPDEIEEL